MLDTAARALAPTDPDAPRAVLGVERSLTGRPWRERLDARTVLVAQAIAQAHGLPDTLARVLAGRDVTLGRRAALPRAEATRPDADPSVLVDMDAAAARLGRAVVRGERVAIFGDYDVDGACSSALLAGFLEAVGVSTRIHIPDRIVEGYGPNVEAIRALAADGARLLVAVDCGTASHEPFAEAARLGLDVVVLDHHQAPETLPAVAALVNPNRQDDLSGLGYLCAAGVVFVALVALARTLRETPGFARPLPNLLDGLDLVALATVADVVPLTGLNRAFVRQGLQVMRGRGRPGLAALFDAAGLAAAPEAWHLGYLVGPRINAGGRIGDASLGARLLGCADPLEAGRMAEALDRLNRERQAIEAEAVEEAVSQAERTLGEAPDAPVLLAAGAGLASGHRRARRCAAEGALPPPGLRLRRRQSRGLRHRLGTLRRGRRHRPCGARGGRRRARREGRGPRHGGGGDGRGRPPRRLRRLHCRAAVGARGAGARRRRARHRRAAHRRRRDAGAVRGPAGRRPLRLGLAPSRSSPSPRTGSPGRSSSARAHVKATFAAGDGRTIDAIAFRCAEEPLGRALLEAQGPPAAPRRRAQQECLGRPRDDRGPHRGASPRPRADPRADPRMRAQRGTCEPRRRPLRGPSPRRARGPARPSSIGLGHQPFTLKRRVFDSRRARQSARWSSSDFFLSCRRWRLFGFAVGSQTLAKSSSVRRKLVFARVEGGMLSSDRDD